jgi:ligand-binding sensor domain-containing protein
LFLASIVLGLKSTAKATLLNENAGLKNIEVTAIAKDKSGLMWVGTKGGLNKYDGYGFQAITYFEKHSVNTILYDSLRDVLWIGTNWGLYYFTCKTNQIVQCTPKLRKNAVTCLLKVEDRIVVGFEEKYILQINADFSCKVIYHFGTNHLLVNRMVADSKGNIYCCFKVLNNIVKINAATHVTTILSNQSTYGIDVLAVFENELYAGGVDNGFWNITRNRKSTWFLDDLNIHNHHPEFVLHHNQKIFLSYRNDSKIFEVNQVDRKIIDLSNQDKDVFNYKRIFSFFCDDYGVVWIGTSKGLIKLTPDKPTIPFEKLLNQWSEQVSTRQILEDDNGDIYVGSYAGFFRFNKRKQQWNNWRTILFKGKKVSLLLVRC